MLYLHMLPRAIVRRLGKRSSAATRPEVGTPAREVAIAELWTANEKSWPLPGFLIGYEGDNEADDTGPMWMHHVEHEYSHGCLNATGCLLPLAMNRGLDRAKLWILTRALVELSGSWHHDAMYGSQGVEALKAEISKLTGFGRREPPMSPYEIGAMTELLAPYLASPGRVPPIAEWGHDGCLRFREADPSPFFDGWLTASAWYPVFPDEPNEGWPRTDGVWRPGVTYPADIGLELARRMGRSTPPRIFLLWAPTI